MYKKNSHAFVQTFEKGLQILEYMVQQKSVTVTSVARHMGIQKSASHRFLNTLRLHGYAMKDANNAYQLTDRLSKLGTGIVPQYEFHEAAARFLDNLARKNRQNNGICNLGMWNGREIVYCVQSANEEYLMFSVGHTVPAYCSALGKAILAWLPSDVLANYLHKTELTPFTRQTICNAADLERELSATRERGYALMNDELYPGLKGLAMPLVFEDAPVRYAVSVTQTIYGGPESFVSTMLDPLAETTGDIRDFMELHGIR